MAERKSDLRRDRSDCRPQLSYINSAAFEAVSSTGNLWGSWAQGAHFHELSHTQTAVGSIDDRKSTLWA